MKFATSVVAATTLLSGFVAAAPTELVARDCSAEIASFNLARREKRGLEKRTFYNGLQNLTCVLSPEVARANYVSNAPIRQDITEGQPGLALTLDIGLMDVTTCQPLKNAMVEVWGPNALGQYGSTFLRGAFQATSAGVAEFQTIFPGFTSAGANHINIAVHQSGTTGSATAHNGQLFFTDRWTDVVAMTANYNQNTNARVLNAQDSNYAAANKNGYSAIVDIESIQDDWPEGVIGYITVGINPTQKISV
ncbi:aromatic compound dioxygenase [Marasmius fiardii PR-910]|nr:aromatic compound dioxygenase [Marasmius fiardii PR-910]